MWDFAWANTTVSSKLKSQASALWVPVLYLTATLLPHAVVFSVGLPQQCSQTRWHQEQKQSSQLWGPKVHNWGAGRATHPPEPGEGPFSPVSTPGGPRILRLWQQSFNLCPYLHPATGLDTCQFLSAGKHKGSTVNSQGHLQDGWNSETALSMIFNMEGWVFKSICHL